MVNASTKIQAAFKRFKARQEFKRALNKREKAINLIQRFWKRKKLLTLIPKALKLRKELAAVVVQKYLKSYMYDQFMFNIMFRAWKRVRIERGKIKLESNLEYFSHLRQRLMIDTQVKIAYIWKKYKKRKMKVIEAMARVAQNQFLNEKQKMKKKQQQSSQIKQSQQNSEKSQLNNQQTASKNINYKGTYLIPSGRIMYQASGKNTPISMNAGFGKNTPKIQRSSFQVQQLSENVNQFKRLNQDILTSTGDSLNQIYNHDDDLIDDTQSNHSHNPNDYKFDQLRTNSQHSKNPRMIGNQQRAFTFRANQDKSNQAQQIQLLLSICQSQDKDKPQNLMHRDSFVQTPEVQSYQKKLKNGQFLRIEQLSSNENYLPTFIADYHSQRTDIRMVRSLNRIVEEQTLSSEQKNFTKQAALINVDKITNNSEDEDLIDEEEKDESTSLDFNLIREKIATNQTDQNLSPLSRLMQQSFKMKLLQEISKQQNKSTKIYNQQIPFLPMTPKVSSFKTFKKQELGKAFMNLSGKSQDQQIIPSQTQHLGIDNKLKLFNATQGGSFRNLLSQELNPIRKIPSPTQPMMKIYADGHNLSALQDHSKKIQPFERRASNAAIKKVHEFLKINQGATLQKQQSSFKSRRKSKSKIMSQRTSNASLNHQRNKIQKLMQKDSPQKELELDDGQDLQNEEDDSFDNDLNNLQIQDVLLLNEEISQEKRASNNTFDE